MSRQHEALTDAVIRELWEEVGMVSGMNVQGTRAAASTW